MKATPIGKFAKANVEKGHEKKLLRAIKVRLLPTEKQLHLFWQSAGVARWAYNAYLAKCDELYHAWKENKGLGMKYMDEATFRRYVNGHLKPYTHTWLKQVSSNVMKQGVKDAAIARNNWFQGRADKPKFKKKTMSKPSFYVNYESCQRINGYTIQCEKLGKIRTANSLPKIKEKYSNPRISFDGKYWFISLGVEVEPENVELTGESHGYDLGVKDTAIGSNGKTYQNINKSKRMRQLNKRLKREQRKLSRKQQDNIEKVIYFQTGVNKGKIKQIVWKKPLKECQNWVKQMVKVNAIKKEMTDIRSNFRHQMTNQMVKAKPSRIVLETLKVKNMLKNRHLAKAIQDQSFFEIKRQIMYKAERYGIEVISVPWNYPSSKLCSDCGHKKTNLKLSDRTYHCEHCGLVMDRDFNASLNLANYHI